MTTLAGTGDQGKDRQGGRVGTEQSLSSPWDLALGSSLGNRLTSNNKWTGGG